MLVFFDTHASEKCDPMQVKNFLSTLTTNKAYLGVLTKNWNYQSTLSTNSRGSVKAHFDGPTARGTGWAEAVFFGLGLCSSVFPALR